MAVSLKDNVMSKTFPYRAKIHDAEWQMINLPTFSIPEILEDIELGVIPYLTRLLPGCTGLQTKEKGYKNKGVVVIWKDKNYLKIAINGTYSDDLGRNRVIELKRDFSN
jgi:hypothetical protein